MSKSEKVTTLMRSGTKQGSKHRILNLNNQDAVLSESFSVSAFGKNFHLGLVSDGCTGNPLFSHNEVGANLLVVYAFRRIQELICAGINILEIPKILFPTITEFLIDLSGKIMPTHILWQYPFVLKGREGWDGATRFHNDYLAATLLGFISDEENITTFSAGDGLILVNNDLTIIDQNDNPSYPVVSINQAGVGFAINNFRVEEINRLVIATDGLKSLLSEAPNQDLLFSFQRENLLGLQIWLNNMFNDFPEKMKDDCSAVTWEKINTVPHTEKGV
ncbi:MAG: protein phosphatase 2C domain-containing protein [Patescibacteria group bacterium]|nr:protein phosphatase 2C domain-containing protein [Patescibacteria group bacterium]